MLANFNWMSAIAGALFAMFVLPMIQGFLASRKTPKA